MSIILQCKLVIFTLHRTRSWLSAISTSKNIVFSDQKHWPISSPKPTRSKLTRAACFAWTSPQTRGWCTIWSTASQSRCFPLQASRCLHTPLRQRPGIFLHWCRHTWQSFASRLGHRSCYTTDKNRKFPVFSPHTVSQSSYHQSALLLTCMLLLSIKQSKKYTIFRSY